jgi:putative hydrolase of the HAD superfamily
MRLNHDPVRCVLLDLYGTLVDLRLNEDSPALWDGLTACLTACGGTVSRPVEVRTLFRRILQEEGARCREGFVMEPVFRRLLAAVAARNEVDYVGRTFRQLSLEELSLRSYVRPLFDSFRRTSCTFGIVSNTEAVLTRFDLNRYPVLLTVDAIVLSSEVGVKKPDPKIFQLALDRLDAAAASTVFVGNSIPDDIVGARGAGLRAVYLDENAPSVEPLEGWNGSVLRVRPTCEALTHALEAFGWQQSRSSLASTPRSQTHAGTAGTGHEGERRGH